MDRVKTISWREYCAGRKLKPILSSYEIMRDLVNKEEVIGVPESPPWKTLKVDIRPDQRAYKAAGWRNFVKSLLP